MENDTKIIYKICPACDMKVHSFFCTKNSHGIYKCRECQMLGIYPLPSGLEDTVYNDDYFSSAEHGFGYMNYDEDKEPMRPVFESYLADLDKYTTRKGKLLDIGAATGFFMDIANKKGWTTEGIDISGYAAKVARSKGLNVKHGVLDNNSFKENDFDVITMWDVIEHLPDPISTLNIVGKLMRDNGILLINTPDSGSLYARLLGKRWHLLVPPEHINYFNYKSIEKSLMKSGFEVVEIKRIGKKFTVEYVVLMLYKWLKLGVIKYLLDFVKQHRKIGQISLPINLNDNMFIIARKIK